MNELLSKLVDFGNAIYAAFLFPGEFLLSMLAAVAPDTATILSLGHGAVIVPFTFALVAWTLVAVAGLLFLKFCRNIARQFSAIIRTISFRISMAMGSFKTMLICRLGWFSKGKIDQSHQEAPTIEVDDLDLAVLRSASAKGPGFALSAPELAEKFTMRPAQIQRSLDKLSRNKMLDSVIGSTDGFENYRLTDYGLAFVAMWQRQQATH